MNITIILAAGEGTRMKSKKSKVLHKIVNRTLIDYVYDASCDAGSDKTIIIVGKNKIEVEEKFGDKVLYKEQKIGKEYPYGTGYAVQLAVDEIRDDDSVLILSGDTPLIKGETLQKLLKEHIAMNSKATVLTAFINDTTGYGHIIKDNNGKFLKIVEDKDATIEEKRVKDRINSEYMKNGVIMENPENTVIEKGISIGIDTFIGSGARIFGNTSIGENVYITGDSFIENSVIGNDVVIRSSYIEDSTVGDSVTMGPFAHLRPKSILKNEVHIGNFVEVKNSTVGENTKAGHLSYIGDAIVGKDVNMGCGSILVNYDGKNKHISEIGDGCFVGSNSNIVSPVKIANDTFIAAGTTVVSDIENEGSLIIGRSETFEKENWVYKKNLKIKK